MKPSEVVKPPDIQFNKGNLIKTPSKLSNFSFAHANVQRLKTILKVRIVLNKSLLSHIIQLIFLFTLHVHIHVNEQTTTNYTDEQSYITVVSGPIWTDFGPMKMSTIFLQNCF